jgi:hypothetical protein
MISAARREDIVGALRRGTVPSSGLDALAVGIESFAPTLDEELAAVAAGRGGFKAVRGEYGTGKTFFGRWLQERARARGFAATEVQINETETPLHRWRRSIADSSSTWARQTPPAAPSAASIDGWFYALEQDVLADASVDANDAEELLARTDALMEARIATISKTAPAFSAVLRTYRRALAAGDGMLADGLISWLAGQPNVAASVKRAAGIKGDLDHFGATNFLVGLLTILRDSGFSGLVLVLDEVETLQRMRTDTREKGLNALGNGSTRSTPGGIPGSTWSSRGRRRSSMARRACSASRRWPNVCTWTSAPTVASTTPGRSRFAWHPSTIRPCWRWDDASATSTPKAAPTSSACAVSWTTATSTRWPAPWPAAWAARSAWRRGCS